ncbi:hypothetical protein [Oceaniferula spumae]
MGSFITKPLLTAVLAVSTMSASAWTPGTGSESATTGFAVDTQSRNDVISFWHTVYQQSEGYETRMNWTGSVASGTPGSTSTAFKNDVQRRINFYRAMAGMDASVDLTSTATVVLGGSTPAAAKPSASTTKQSAAQAAALMLSRNSAQYLPGGGVATGAHNPHDPPSSWSLDNSTARNGAFHSNLAVGHYGPGAIDAYMSEDAQGAAGGENSDAGHRRYILFSRIQEFASGDVTGDNDDYYPANALYVSGNLLTPPASPKFIPWPNAGYIPEQITPQRWSLSFPDADFSSASVSMTDINGSPVSLSIVSKTASYADNTIVWKPNSGAIASADFDDQTYNVTVSNINIGGSLHSYSYQVTIINPNRLLESTDLFGSTSPPNSGANYFFNPIEQAEEYQLDVSTLTSAAWFEGAEDGTDALIVDGTDAAYDLRTAHTWQGNQFWHSGSKAFRLAFPVNEFDAFQSFLINRTIIPRAGGAISFRFRRGYMASNTRLSVQSSTDGGVTWTTLQFYSGTNRIDNFFSSQTVNLPSTNQETLLRFVLHQPANTGVFSLQTHSNFPIGAFVDDITPVNCDVLESLAPTTYSASSDFVTLNASTGGGALNVATPYTLRLRVRVGNHWFPFGQALEVTPVSAASLSNYQLWFRGQYAIVGSFSDDYDQDGIPNGVERVFGLNPLDGSDGQSALSPQISGGNFSLSHAIIPGASVSAECSTTLAPGSWQPVSVTISGGVATATVPLNTPTCFIRWVSSES